LTDESDDSLKRHRTKSEMTRDIRSPREVYDDERREAADKSLRAFLESYFAAAFPLAWSPDHLEVIETLETVATKGGLYALAMPRGSGKTSIAMRAALWALLTGRRKYVEVIASTETAAKKLIKQLRQELSFNDQLRLDYPAEMHGIWQLKGDNRRAGGQLCDGEKTGVVLGVSEIVFPSHKYTPIGGSIVYAAGLTGNVRGPNHTRLDGSVIRPDFVILDDPQTRESATSSTQTQERCEIIEGDVLGLAGPGQSIAAVMPCTVIAKDDLADRFLQNPHWKSKRAKLLYSFPSDMAAWDRYFEFRSEVLRTRQPDGNINEYYEANRGELSAGSVVGWESRKEPTEVDALQSAMHLWFRSPAAFSAEYNNDPIGSERKADSPSYAGLVNKTNGMARGVCPIWANTVTVGIDVQKRALFYVVVAWSAEFSGQVIDYGAWPKQSRAYYSLSELNPTLQQASGSSQDTGAWMWGLNGLVSDVVGQPWEREDGGQLSVSRALVDANYGESTDTVYEFCRRTVFNGVLMPSHGRGIKAGDRPMSEWPKKIGEQHGYHWIATAGDGRRSIRHVIFDTNHWKTFLAARVAAMDGEKGSLSVFGKGPEQHRLLSDHLTAESCEPTQGRGRELWEWRCRPGVDNHFLDCLVLAGVAASQASCSLQGIASVASNQRRTFQLPTGSRRA